MILAVGIIDLVLALLSVFLLFIENIHAKNKESLTVQRISKKYIFYLTLTVAMTIRGLFLVLSSFDVLKSLTLNMIWILLGDIVFLIVYGSTIIIYDNVHYKLRAEYDYRLNSYTYLKTLRPYLVTMGCILSTMFFSSCIFFTLFNHRDLGSSYLVACSIIDMIILSLLYALLTLYFLHRALNILIMWIEYQNLQHIAFKKWTVGTMTLGVMLITICYLGRTIFNFYDLKTWDHIFSYPVNSNVQIYMYLLLETLPMLVFLIFLTKIRTDLLDVVKTKLRLRRF